MKMQSTDLFSTLKRFDAYPKTLEDFRVKTLGGGAGVCVISQLHKMVVLLVVIYTPSKELRFI